jgi:cytochrome c553
LKDGSRKNPIMNAIAAQLSTDDMTNVAAWGAEFPEMLRNGNWNYAVFTPEKQRRPGVNQAEYLACHKPLDGVSYTFTLKELAAASK